MHHNIFIQEGYTESMQKRQDIKRHEILSSLTDCQQKEIHTNGLALIEDQDHQLDAIEALPSLYISGTVCNYPCIVMYVSSS